MEIEVIMLAGGERNDLVRSPDRGKLSASTYDDQTTDGQVSAAARNKFSLASERISLGLSVAFLLAFVVLLYALIANASHTAALVVASRDLEDGYKRAADLFSAKRSAEDAADLAEFDSTNPANLKDGVVDGEKRRALAVANQKRAVAQDAFSNYSGEFFQIVCFSITDLHGLHYPTRFFISANGITDCALPASEDRSGIRQDNQPLEEKQQVIPRTGGQNIYMVRQLMGAAANVSNFYVLPVLFGCIGAFIFAIRHLLDDWSTWFDLRTVLGYYVRTALGAICGLIIGYFNIGFGNGVSQNAVISTSPLLLSLVAGFSVDSVLSILERLAFALRYESPSGQGRRATRSGRTQGSQRSESTKQKASETRDVSNDLGK